MNPQLLLLFFSIILYACQPQIVFDINPDPFEGYNIPEYFQEHILEQEGRIKEILSVHQNVTSFIFFTDAHWELNSRNSPEIIRHIKDSTGIDFVFFGGDAINGSKDKVKALTDLNLFSDLFFRFNSFFPVYGNHDSNIITDNIANPYAWFSDEEVYSSLFYKLNSNVKYGGDFYYCIDDVNSKTRFFCLDSGRHGFSDDEIIFLANSLISLPPGWHVVIVTHIVYNARDLLDPETFHIPNGIDPLIRIADAYNERITFRMTETTEYDFSGAVGSIDCIFGGHIHRDYVGNTNSGIPIIISDCDCPATFSSVGSKAGTINEQCVSVIIIDHDNAEIHLIRFGRGEDVDISMADIKNKKVRNEPLSRLIR